MQTSKASEAGHHGFHNLDGLVHCLDGVALAGLQGSLGLILQALGLQGRVVDRLANSLLGFAQRCFDGACDLVFVGHEKFSDG